MSTGSEHVAMTRFGVACGLIVLIVSAPVFAGAPEAADCCACFVPDHHGPVTAFFCVSGGEREIIVASQRCEDIPDAELICVGKSSSASLADSVSPDCVEELREANIICGAQAPVPALGIPALVVVAAALSLLGALTLRRRGRSGASRQSVS